MPPYTARPTVHEVHMSAVIQRVTLHVDGEVEGDARVVAESVLGEGYEAASLGFEVAWEIVATRNDGHEYNHEFDIVFTFDTDEDCEALANDIMNAGYEQARAADGGPSNATIYWETV
jgi:hypothetical protein